jgi:hypothetical protein
VQVRHTTTGRENFSPFHRNAKGVLKYPPGSTDCGTHTIKTLSIRTLIGMKQDPDAPQYQQKEGR